ncbi:MAG: alpha-2-macroglobulin, partial [Desulfobacterales bacterium]|nr:alpha-2-macroglobulin [Desulfobacterales bacterium]
TLGRGDGWGHTNANASALLALTEFLAAPPGDPGEQAVEAVAGQEVRRMVLDKDHPIKRIAGAFAGETRISLQEKGSGGDLIVRAETRYTPAADGAAVEARARGFVISREMLRIQKEDAPPERFRLDAPDKTISLAVGDIIEEHIELVNPADRAYVAVVIPLAAGMEPLNPSLATAPAEAEPAGRLTLAPSYTAFMDDRTTYYYNTLPKGAYHFYFRARATIPGRFIQPPARAEMMYDLAVNGNGNGARVEVKGESK